MSEPSSHLEYFFLPVDVWLSIVVYLDVETLQALQESDVAHRDVWHVPTLSRTLTLSRHSDASALLRHLQRCDARSVRTLRLTGCLMAVPQQVFLALSACVHLSELYCVNCILSPRHLFDMLITSLSCLVRLEWSLFNEQTYLDRFDDIAASDNNVLPQLRRMYVEVDDDFATCDLFKRIRKRCVNLEHLHVHALHVKESATLAACKKLVNPDWTLESFAYTSQRFSQIGKWLLVRALELQVPLGYLCVGSATFGNITYRMKPVFSCTATLWDASVVRDALHYTLQGNFSELLSLSHFSGFAIINSILKDARPSGRALNYSDAHSQEVAVVLCVQLDILAEFPHWKQVLNRSRLCFSVTTAINYARNSVDKIDFVKPIRNKEDVQRYSRYQFTAGNNTVRYPVVEKSMAYVFDNNTHTHFWRLVRGGVLLSFFAYDDGNTLGYKVKEMLKAYPDDRCVVFDDLGEDGTAASFKANGTKYEFKAYDMLKAVLNALNETSVVAPTTATP
ncbi:hypothetical protein V5799_021371 [Amblyomma americanum]|uniref:Uncharacterized protein n=1 Tax=Amblyomma americanum TaxID=6943 RepID=A0AAQ4FNP7_AMBAM